MKNDKLYSAAISVFVALNAFDLFTTVTLVTIRVAEEQNPLMAYFLTKGPLVFGLVKALATAACSYAFWKIKQSPSAWATLGLSLVGYVALVTYQIYLIYQLFQTLTALVPK